MDIQLREKAIKLIPELENMLGIDMSIDSFIKNDLPYYFNVIANKNEDCIDLTYNFETNYGSGQITVESFGEEAEEIIWNNIVQVYIDNEKIAGTK
tara:strand:+ start:576 stop:863 length:288 start_codon:yes stop_codon:yes gene_type:complete